MTDRYKILRLVAFSMLSLSVLLIILGIYFYIDKSKELKEYKLVKCKIMEINEPNRGNAVLTMRDVNRMYPQFQYHVSYDASESELDYKVNEIYDVYYNEKDPSKSEIKDFLTNYQTAFILLVVGIVFLIDFPILLFVTSRIRTLKTKNRSEHYGIKDSVISE